jgi:hypothetical protein
MEAKVKWDGVPKGTEPTGAGARWVLKVKWVWWEE